MPDLDRRTRYEGVVRQVIEPVRRYLARRTDATTAEDVLADTLLVCWRRLDDVPAEPLPWVYVVARNCLANAERAARRQGRLVRKLGATAGPSTVPGPDSDGGDPVLACALANLRPADAELLRLWAWDELTPGELAGVLGVSENAVNIRLHRARGRLRDELRKCAELAGHDRGERRTDR
ncbi:MAG: sigma-70 family RNA polymerase sigma factor [Propionicimonas sp.]|uniref:RNA polymerase sigma factor n=1 Tax=Propionicimonas sp. TaxID=1955623 RepID=UPI002B1F625C|nr:sigma-70 family RNA polymerase sigma factor [Propionicimonas sp.]MEA4945728.1 sigma-70 family RNA polymerase sigma factor [Propionicimonas sp.]MEA5116135.1 sigma-70 family RNA polymerase sigma factor [Propionicimonas sp.]